MPHHHAYKKFRLQSQLGLHSSVISLNWNHLSLFHPSPLSNHYHSPQSNYPASLTILGRYFCLLLYQMIEVKGYQFNSASANRFN